MDSKETLRNKMKKKLSSLSLEEKIEIEKTLYNHLFSSTNWKQADVIATTISKGIEWDTGPIIENAWKQGKQIALPKCYPEKADLKFYTFESYEQLETVYYGLLEPAPDKTVLITPEQIDLVLVPGLVFDQKRFRVGHGGGYYDRFLAHYTGDTMSLASVNQIIDTIPVESFDIPVDQLITNDQKKPSL
ncbi:hypothetical protein GCM10011351_17140 [Paraliobacillus quinghaiensis]|uniref:5-formyltetrahydrofolate cyclo-ligase n=1 Tax=Paraliobacillus quinghaiensis TaxID=470815 RepID=A0A917TPX9_9BACI|nr:5-formyltetrahydrofolate cyclo-ligase [Paraliobacillus quinghaiensis]GGM31546.1 hypothetical protein GCM10011351_17140 [Paraliobacillus quinghaiensis]